MNAVGQQVRVVRLCDDSANPEYVGKRGKVVRLDEGSGDWPVGESPNDPLYFVALEGGHMDAFWGEELEVIHVTYVNELGLDALETKP